MQAMDKCRSTFGFYMDPTSLIDNGKSVCKAFIHGVYLKFRLRLC